MEKSHVDTRASRRRFKTLRRRLTSMMMLLVILVPFAQAAGMPGRMISAEPGVLTIAYDNDENGSAPAQGHAWQPKDQTDVLNPLGGKTETGQLFTNNNNDIETLAPNDNGFASRTLLQYGESGYDPKENNPAYSISKYATQTATPGRYNVTLTATGNNTTKETAKPLEIVFVVDMSGSMEQEQQSVSYYYDPWTKNHEKYIPSDASIDHYFDKGNVFTASRKMTQFIRVDAINDDQSYSDDPTDYRFVDGYGNWYQFDRANNFNYSNRLLRNTVYLTRADFAQSGIKKALNLISEEKQSGQLPGKVSVGLVGFSSNGYGTNETSVELGEFNNTQAGYINDALNRSFSGGTWTQNGLERGAEMFSSDSNASKIMILLTDGQPTFAGSPDHIVGDGHSTDSTVWDPTQIAARTIKDTIHLQGISIDTPDNQIANFEDLTSKKPNSDEHDYVPVANGDAIADALMADVKFDIENFSSPNTVSNGQIDDPLGARYKYVAEKEANVTGTNLTEQQKDAVKSQLRDQLGSNDRKLTIDGLNLGKGQTIKISYQVQLQTESEGFEANHWYPMNGETTFKPRSTDSTTVDFGIPSGRAPSVEVPVKKVWNTLDKTTKLPDTLSVTIGRSKQTEDSKVVDSNWSEKLSLKNSDNWKGSISAPAYDNSGKAFTYFVSDESKAGYSDPDSYILSSTGTGTAEDPVIATNQQYGFQFVKKDSKTTKEINDSSMEFSLTSYPDSNFQEPGSLVANLNQTKPHALAPGYYGIKEKNAPKGYVLDATEYYFQLTSAGKWNYFGTAGHKHTGTSISNQQALNTIDGQTDAFDVAPNRQNILQLTKYDKPKPSVLLTVVKTDNQGTPLADAQFTLTDDNAKKDLESLTSDDSEQGKTFQHQLQANGSYTLSETQAPLGYQKSNNTVSIQIKDDGTIDWVKVNDTELKSGKTLSGYKLTSTPDGPGLTLIVENQPLSILPHTGGQGIVRAAAFALMMLVVAAVLAIVVWIKRRGVRIHD